jgi:hypothetical protein
MKELCSKKKQNKFSYLCGPSRNPESQEIRQFKFKYVSELFCSKIVIKTHEIVENKNEKNVGGKSSSYREVKVK